MRIFYLLILTSVFVACNDAPEQHELPFPTWVITIDNFGSPYGDVCAMQNGGCAVVRESEGQTTVLMFDAYGDQLRQVNFEKYTSEGGSAICETHSGDLLVTGRMGSDVFVAFIPSTNDTIRQLHYDLSGASEIGRAITEAPDGSVFVCGQFNHQFGLLKLNQDLEVEWIRFAGDSLNSEALAVAVLPDSNIAVAGESLDISYIAVFDQSGILLREQFLEEDSSSIVDLAAPTNYRIFAAGTFNGIARTHILDINLNLLDVISTTSTDEYDVKAMVTGANGLPTMLCTEFHEDYSRVMLGQGNLYGRLVWSQYYMLNGGNAVSLATCPDGGYFLYGYNSPYLDLILIKVDENGYY